MIVNIGYLFVYIYVNSILIVFIILKYDIYVVNKYLFIYVFSIYVLLYVFLIFWIVNLVLVGSFISFIS